MICVLESDWHDTFWYCIAEPVLWGTVLKMDKPSTLIYTFTFGAFNGATTTITWTLEEIAGGTRLTLKHEGISEAAGETQ